MRGRTSRPSRLLVSCAVGALLLGGCDATESIGESPAPGHTAEGVTPSRPAASESVGPVTEGPPTKAPRTPPARICGSPKLAGPAAPPPGAHRVDVGADLRDVVDQAPPGTTFWLAPGTHHLGDGEYDQVIPKDRDRFIGAPGAVLDGRKRNLYAFTGEAADVTISHLTIQNFGTRTDNRDQGVVNHDSGAGWRVEHNTVRHNGGAGVFLGSGAVVTDNCLAENGQYGFSAYSEDGPRDVVLRHNEIARNNTADWESRVSACGCTGGGKFWATSGAVVTDNWVHDNHGPGLWADNNNTGFLIKGNFISDNGAEALIYETSYNAAIEDNTMLRNGFVKGSDDPGFPVPAIYLSESGSDPRAGAAYGHEFLVRGNRIVDNWSGLVAWENADRFAGSPANPTDDSTLVNPGVATASTCADHENIRKRPWFDDCRWKTQHLRIVGNHFEFHPERLGDRCTPARGCGFVGLFSNFGTYPDWSPFKGTGVERRITFGQDNRWADNSYVGPWRFMATEQGKTVTWEQWRSAPYNQDGGSTMQSSGRTAR